MIALIVNLLGFNVVWTAAVMGAAHGMAVLGLAAYAVFAGWQFLVASHRPGRDLVLTLVVVPTGWLVDSALAALGWLHYAPGWPGPGLAPWWIALLWANFVLILNHGLAPLHARPALAAVLGALGGPFAYLVAERLGAVSFPPGHAPGLLALAVVWASAMPLLFGLNRGVTRLINAGRNAS